MNIFGRSYWRFAKALAPLTAVSALTTIVLNAQSLDIAHAWAELVFWGETFGGLAMVLAAGLVLIFRKGNLVEGDLLSRWLSRASSVILIVTGLTLCGRFVVDMGLETWASVQAALVTDIALLIWLVRSTQSSSRKTKGQSLQKSGGIEGGLP